MTRKFNTGETTGFKANPAHAAKAMMTTKNDNGDRMFTSEEFLTTQQVSSFFSRLASKKRLPNVQDDDDALAVENETPSRSSGISSSRSVSATPNLLRPSQHV